MHGLWLKLAVMTTKLDLALTLHLSFVSIHFGSPLELHSDMNFLNVHWDCAGTALGLRCDNG
jgi:hypothetical protein